MVSSKYMTMPPGSRDPHTRDGKKLGMFHHLPNGKKVYMAWRSGSGKSTKGYYAKKNGWCIDKTTMASIKAFGATAIGVHWRNGSKTHIYLTNTEDFENPPSERHWGDCEQRLLNRDRMRLHVVRTAKGFVSGIGSLIAIGKVSHS